MSVKTTQGLHCKACDAMFDSNDFDDELCLKCYMAMLLILDTHTMSDKDFESLIEEEDESISQS